MAKADEPIKKAITATLTDDQVLLVYNDGGLKVLQQNIDAPPTVVYIYAEDLAEVIQAIKKK